MQVCARQTVAVKKRDVIYFNNNRRYIYMSAISAPLNLSLAIYTYISIG